VPVRAVISGGSGGEKWFNIGVNSAIRTRFTTYKACSMFYVLLTISEQLGSSTGFFCWVRVGHFLLVFCVVFFILSVFALCLVPNVDCGYGFLIARSVFSNIYLHG
jgi:hypothetical protein